MPRLQLGSLATSTSLSGPQCFAMRAAPDLLWDDVLVCVTVIFGWRSSGDGRRSAGAAGAGDAISTLWMRGASPLPIRISVRDLLRDLRCAGAGGGVVAS